MRVRLTVAVTFVVLTFALVACGQRGSPELAGRAADDFLGLLTAGDAEGAWAHLTPSTQASAYRDELTAFANEVEDADWSQLTWEIGAVSDYDTSWGVRVRVEGSSVPPFLRERRIVGGQEGTETIMLLVQFASQDTYLIAGQGLDEEL